MATDYTAFLDALSAALDTRDLLLANRDGSLPAITVGTLPTAIGRGVPNGVAALNGAGVPITSQGAPMAVIGTTPGTAADAAVVAASVATAAAAAAAAQASANSRMLASGVIKDIVFTSTSAAPTAASATAAGYVNGTLIITPGA